MAEWRNQALAKLLQEILPGAKLRSVEPIGADEAADDEATEKGAGYGVPLLITAAAPDGRQRRLVLHTAKSDCFGHDRRADRASSLLLAYDRFRHIPRHTAALDVGAITVDGRLKSLRESGEFYLVTAYTPGAVYADDLRRIAKQNALEENDLKRCQALARYLAGLHREEIGDPVVYRRAVRDLVGHGEGIFGIIDSYPAETPGAPLHRLRLIEQSCIEWRWKLRGCERRLRRTHGDFHPFNILFDENGDFTLLDASRGCAGDPADDVTCLAINYVFFALEHAGSWKPAFARLWRAFWSCYTSTRPDEQIFEAAPPYFAWRALVLANPLWYPHTDPAVRDKLLGFAEDSLARGRLDPQQAEELFA